jgi:leader peptidase (prepilin peptidase)/N-methyltransferase
MYYNLTAPQTDPTLGAIVAILLGLLAGFVINIVATRLANDKPIFGRLACTRSAHPISRVQALPVVGYLLQRGQCSTCGKKLSIAYPATEGATALLFLLLFVLERLSVPFFFHAAYTTILMLVLVMDWKHRDIYLSVIGVGWLVALLGSLVLPGIGTASIDLVSALIGAAVAGGFFALAYIMAKVLFRNIEEPLGSGDVLLALMMGLMLGFPNVVGALVIGPLIAGAVAIILLLTRRSRMGDFMPYGVSLCVAAIIFLVNPGPLADALHLSALVSVFSNLF